MTKTSFQKLVKAYYQTHGRDLPWRHTKDPYKILVSEVMLQQTQVARVIPKYQQFIQTFPDFAALSRQPLSKVLEVWSGLGYNRRAKYLWEAAKIIKTKHEGQLPKDINTMQTLPGIGKNTAAAVCVYSFNQPLAFIETNIRSVFLHNFFKDLTDVPDSEILPVVEDTMDRENPREWYWALMDYGTYLKQLVPNPSRRSKHHARQTPFEGSQRQLRAQILKTLLEGPLHKKQLLKQYPDSRTPNVLNALIQEGFIASGKGMFKLT